MMSHILLGSMNLMETCLESLIIKYHRHIIKNSILRDVKMVEILRSISFFLKFYMVSKQLLPFKVSFPP